MPSGKGEEFNHHPGLAAMVYQYLSITVPNVAEEFKNCKVNLPKLPRGSATLGEILKYFQDSASPENQLPIAGLSNETGEKKRKLKSRRDSNGTSRPRSKLTRGKIGGMKGRFNQYSTLWESSDSDDGHIPYRKISSSTKKQVPRRKISHMLSRNSPYPSTSWVVLVAKGKSVSSGIQGTNISPSNVRNRVELMNHLDPLDREEITSQPEELSMMDDDIGVEDEPTLYSNGLNLFAKPTIPNGNTDVKGTISPKRKGTTNGTTLISKIFGVNTLEMNGSEQKEFVHPKINVFEDTAQKAEYTKPTTSVITASSNIFQLGFTVPNGDGVFAEETSQMPTTNPTVMTGEADVEDSEVSQSDATSSISEDEDDALRIATLASLHAKKIEDSDSDSESLLEDSDEGDGSDVQSFLESLYADDSYSTEETRERLERFSDKINAKAAVFSKGDNIDNDEGPSRLQESGSNSNGGNGNAGSKTVGHAQASANGLDRRKYKAFTCALCKESMVSCEEFQTHVSQHNEAIPIEKRYAPLSRGSKCTKKFSCCLCGNLYRNEKMHFNHFIRFHACFKPYNCNYCEARFTRLNALTRHTQKDHSAVS